MKPTSPRKRRVNLPADDFVEVVSAGVLAHSSIHDGRPISHLILDTTDKPKIEELVRLHMSLPPGEVRSGFGQSTSEKHVVVLHLEFINPAPVNIAIRLPARQYPATVDLILRSRLAYLQCGRPGDKLSTTLADTPAILVEVNPTGHAAAWDKMLNEAVVRGFVKQGLRGKAAEAAARAQIASWRDLGDERLKTPGGG